MRISMRADYGVRAMTDLAIHAGQGPVQSADIARRMIVPPVYLDQVMGGLRKAGLVRSTRGPQGGHQLARPPETISLADIVLALEGPFSLLDCLDDVAACDLSDICSQRPVWTRVRAALDEVLRRVLLSELAADMQEARERPAYSI